MKEAVLKSNILSQVQGTLFVACNNNAHSTGSVKVKLDEKDMVRFVFL